MKTEKYCRPLSAVLLTALMAGCGGGGSDSGSNVEDRGTTPTPSGPDVSSATLNATSTENFVYFNLTTGSAVNLTAAEAATSTAWHVAFRRTEIKLNGGASGDGNVAGAVVAAQDDFYDASGEPLASVFLNATADSELEHLTGTLTAPANSALNLDALISNLQVAATRLNDTDYDYGWYIYHMNSHALSVNPDNGWLLRSGEGNSYARFHATDLTYVAGGLDVTFEFDVQPAGTSQFTSTATFNAVIGAAGGEVCFDFDTDQNVACTGNAWDLKVAVAGRNIALFSNGGVSGSGLGRSTPMFDWSEVSTFVSAVDATTVPAVLYTADSTGGIFTQKSWYAYDLDGTHKLHPNYRVYWIDTDKGNTSSAKYAVQITGYYSSVGVSANPTVRWRAISN